MAGELATITDQNWLDVRTSTQTVPMPFQHEVLLKECHVAGTMHVDDILCKTQTVGVGSPLVLKRLDLLLKRRLSNGHLIGILQELLPAERLLLRQLRTTILLITKTFSKPSNGLF